ncbi:MAG: MnmC family methyltransferase [Cyanobacteria bacterium P01_F01_bin.150]
MVHVLVKNLMVQSEKTTHQDIKHEKQSTGLRSQKLASSPQAHPFGPFVPKVTADGSYTFFSPDFQEAFHSHQGAKLEAELKFVKTTQIEQLAQRPTVNILDVCYGLGYNTAAALTTIWQINPGCHVHWFGLELDINVPKAAIAHHLLDPWPTPITQLLTALATTSAPIQGRRQKAEGRRRNSPPPHLPTPPTPQLPFTGQLLLGDARQTIQTVQSSGFHADAIFLDPFSPISCPQLWTVEFLSWVVRCLATNGRLTTYSCSAAARTALRMTGLILGSTPGVGRKSPGTVASFTAGQFPSLSQKEEEHLKTRSSIPYRDPTLTDTKEIIIQRRRQEQSESNLETTSQWKKRWTKQDQ